VRGSSWVLRSVGELEQLRGDVVASHVGCGLVERLVSADARRRVEIEIELPNIPDVASSTTA